MYGLLYLRNKRLEFLLLRTTLIRIAAHTHREYIILSQRSRLFIIFPIQTLGGWISPSTCMLCCYSLAERKPKLVTFPKMLLGTFWTALAVAILKHQVWCHFYHFIKIKNKEMTSTLRHICYSHCGRNRSQNIKIPYKMMILKSFQVKIGTWVEKKNKKYTLKNTMMSLI